jgi:hypothetical protein
VRRERAAVAYLTSDEFVKFAGGDVLVTDASDRDDTSVEADTDSSTAGNDIMILKMRLVLRSRGNLA